MEQYFEAKPSTEEKIYNFEWTIMGKNYSFNSSNSVFSKRAIDFGTMAMLETFRDNNEEFTGDFLDLGCGIGPVGVVIGDLYKEANITMVDVNQRAVMLSQLNIKANNVFNAGKIIASDGFEAIEEETFDVIMTNPPIRAGKKTIFSFYEKAYDHLKLSGSLYVVIQKKQGAASSIKKLEDLFGNCEILNKKKGYWILEAVKVK